MDSFFNFDYISWVLMPGLIFLARIIDVTLATLRQILIYKGFRLLVPCLAFIEVSIWLIAITQVMQNLNNWACFIAWAGGVSAGTYVGMFVEEKLALGYQIVRVITVGGSSGLLQGLSERSYGVTSVQAAGSKGGVEIFLIVSERRRLKDLLKFIRSLQPVPFYTIEDVRTVGAGSWMKNLTPAGSLNGTRLETNLKILPDESAALTNTTRQERELDMGDKSPKAINKKAAHEQTKTKKAKKRKKHLALFQQTGTSVKKK